MNQVGPADADLVSASHTAGSRPACPEDQLPPTGRSATCAVPRGVGRHVCAGNCRDLAKMTVGTAKGFHSSLSARLLLLTPRSLPTTALETRVTWEKGCGDPRDTRRHRDVLLSRRERDTSGQAQPQPQQQPPRRHGAARHKERGCLRGGAGGSLCRMTIRGPAPAPPRLRPPTSKLRKKQTPPRRRRAKSA